MLCYKDRSYCGSIAHHDLCYRQITKEELADAERIGLPIAYINYCD